MKQTLAIPGLRPEFNFAAEPAMIIHPSGGKTTSEAGSVRVDGFTPGRDFTIDIATVGKSVRLVVLTEQEAEHLWLVPDGNSGNMAMLSEASVFAAGNEVHLRSVDPEKARAMVYSPGPVEGQAGTFSSVHSSWKEFSFSVHPRKIRLIVEKSRDADLPRDVHMGPYQEFRKTSVPLAPEDADFTHAAVWKLRIPAQSMEGLSDIFLKIQYIGDVARLYQDHLLLDDDFYNGRTWEIGLKQFLPSAFDAPMELRTLPLNREEPIYLDTKAWEGVPPKDSIAAVESLELLPEYEVIAQTTGNLELIKLGEADKKAPEHEAYRVTLPEPTPSR